MDDHADHLALPTTEQTSKVRAALIQLVAKVDQH
jgi:hypothetical protein